MEFDNMDHMPEWKHFVPFGAEEESTNSLSTEETLKRKLKLLRAEKLYNQAREVYKYAALFCETLEGDLAEMTSTLIMQNALILCPKIIGAEGADVYILRMENASIIRTNCRELETQVKAADIFEICTPEYRDIVLNEVEKFRILFIDWVKYFERDSTCDDWGLY